MTTAMRTRSVSATHRRTLHELRTLIKQKSRSELAFKCISSGVDFHLQVHERIRNPLNVRQGNTPLCGPAAFMYCVAKYFPDHYEQYALELALFGKSRLGDLVVEPSDRCRNARDGLSLRNEGHHFSAADWVTLASIRDSSNVFSRMSGPGSNVAGMTFPGALISWFEDTGLFTKVEDHTSTAVTSSYDNLLRANEKLKAGHCVCFLIQGSILAPMAGIELGANKFQKDTPKIAAPLPNHWVVQITQMMIGYKPAPRPGLPADDSTYNSSLQFDVHSWGAEGKAYPVNARVSDISPEEFTRYYHGFVCAKPRLD